VNLMNVDTGFNKENALRLQTDASSVGYKVDDPRLTALYPQVEERASALPSVRAASYSSFTFHEGSWNGYICVPGVNINHHLNVEHNVVGSGYFATTQIPLVTGRTFGPQDTATSQRVFVIRERRRERCFRKAIRSDIIPHRRSEQHLRH